MSYYHTCPLCGANLDPCEKCDCENERRAYALELIKGMTIDEKRELLAFVQLLKARQDRSQPMTDNEVKAMAEAARRRIHGA